MCSMKDKDRKGNHEAQTVKIGYAYASVKTEIWFIFLLKYLDNIVETSELIWTYQHKLFIICKFLLRTNSKSLIKKIQQFQSVITGVSNPSFYGLP